MKSKQAKRCTRPHPRPTLGLACRGLLANAVLLVFYTSPWPEAWFPKPRTLT